MTPIVVTNSSPAGLVSRVKAPPPNPIIPPDWEIFRDFNTGPDGATANFQADGFNDLGGFSRYTNEQVYAGAFSCKLNINAGTPGTDNGFGTWGGKINFPTTCVKGDTLWFEQYYYMPTSFVVDSSPGWLKYLRFWTTPNGVTNRGYLDVYLRNDVAGAPFKPYQIIKEGQDLWVYFGADNRKFLRDQWVRQTVQIVIDNVTVASGGTAKVRFWENGQLIVDTTTIQTISNAIDYMPYFYLHTLWNGGAPSTVFSYVDNIRFAKNGVPTWVLDLPGI
jgi:hypothetical protein